MYHAVLSVPCCAAVRHDSHQPQVACFLFVQAQATAVGKAQTTAVLCCAVLCCAVLCCAVLCVLATLTCLQQPVSSGMQGTGDRFAKHADESPVSDSWPP